MKRRVLAILVSLAAVALFAVLPGCTAPELERTDRIIGHVDAAGTIAGQVAADPPASELIPPRIRTALELLGFAGAAAVIVWQRIRASKILEKQTS